MKRADGCCAGSPDGGLGLPFVPERRSFMLGITAMVLSPLAFSSLCSCRRSESSDQITNLESAAASSARSPIPHVEPFVRVRVGRVRVAMTELADSDAEGGGEHDESTADASEPTVTIGEQGQMLRVLQPDHLRRHIVAHAPVRFSMGVGGWAITDGRGFRLPIYELSPVLLLPLDRESDGGHLQFGGRRFPDMLNLTPISSAESVGFDIVNHVQMESYLPGVVERELYNHWHFETHAAQAIAARSFACAERAWWSDRRHFDLTDSQASQVYAGVVTHQRSIDAVHATRGVVLAHDEHVFPAYYSSSCGGLPARAVDAIGPNPINDIPPLRGNGNGSRDVCLAAPLAAWKIRHGRETVLRRIARFGSSQRNSELAALKSLRTIEVAAVNEHGRPTMYVISDAAGQSVKIGAEMLRRAINTADGKSGRLQRPLRSSFFEVEVSGSDFVFHGHGFGHGVGMCQHGAQLRATAGASHRDILRWYYPGAEIVHAYA